MQRVANRREFVAALKRRDVDIILADYSLPDFDGLSALTIARRCSPRSPFIFVSGVVGEEFATNALKRGATDYVLKRNLVASANAVERALEQALRTRPSVAAPKRLLRHSETSAKLAVGGGAARPLGISSALTARLKWDARCRALFGLAPDTPRELPTLLDGCHPDDRAPYGTRHAVARLHWDARGPFALSGRVPGILTPEGASAGSRRADRRASRTALHAIFVGVVRDVTEERRARRLCARLADDARTARSRNARPSAIASGT